MHHLRNGRDIAVQGVTPNDLNTFSHLPPGSSILSANIR
jgi:hypothetical protein